MQLKILFFDIETAPLLAHMWHPKQDWVPPEAMVHDSFMLTWAAKWRGQKKIITGGLTKGEVLEQDDSRIVADLAELIREADIVVAHNIDRFDLPRLRGRVMLNGQEPLGPVQTIDTLTLARKNFGLSHNNLTHLASELGFGHKIDTDFSLWLNCYHGDMSAFKKMLRYNKHDVVLLEQIFEAMLPHVQRLPRLWDYDSALQCPHCGVTGRENFQARGKKRTAVNTYQQFQCKTCKRYFRNRTSTTNLLTQPVPV